MSERIDFLGLTFDNLSLSEALGRIETFIQERKPRKIFTPNVALLIWSREDPFLKRVYSTTDIVGVDGMAIYYGARLLGTPFKESLSASLLYFPLMELAHRKGYRIYLVGAKEEILARCAENLQEKYPGINIVGKRDGYFNHEAPPEEFLRDVRAKKPDIMFVAMSTPYKERFLDANLEEMNVPVSIGVGGMFDITAGAATFAPSWIRKLCLEWLYRLIQEPRRMWRRYWTTNSVFLWLLLVELVRRRLMRRRTAARNVTA